MSSSLSIIEAAREAPGEIACICDAESITFHQMAIRTAATLRWLHQQYGPLASNHSKIPQNCFAVVATNQVATLILIYALLELGWPLALLHPRLPVQERTALHRRFGFIRIFEPGWDRAASPTHSDIDVPTPMRGESSSACFVVFTAGTTGSSKAAVLSYGAIQCAVEASAQNLGWQPQDRWLLCLPLAHVGGLSIVLRCLAARKAVLIPQPQGADDSLDIQQIAQGITRHNATLISVVPTVLQRLLELPDFSPPASLRAILMGGDGASAALLQQALQRGLPVFTTYGMTEMSSQVTTQRYALGPGGDSGNGPAIRTAQVRIATDGRIEVRGPSLFSGYWEPPALDLPLTADGWFRTEDYGSLDDKGSLHVLGRSTDVLISGGENVYPAQIERTILTYPGVERCCAFGLPDPNWGEVVCALVVAPGAERTAFAAFLQQRLMRHQLPRRLAFIERLPETPVGKLDRKAAALEYRAQLLPLEYP
ncbi:MAG TPA: AMP-binding protein [Polyangiaceae bacterium]|nr:AMP-binding protein [Polyangiaceae bacterium]